MKRRTFLIGVGGVLGVLALPDVPTAAQLPIAEWDFPTITLIAGDSIRFTLPDQTTRDIYATCAAAFNHARLYADGRVLAS